MLFWKGLTSITILFHTCDPKLQDLESFGGCSHIIILLLKTGFTNIVRSIACRVPWSRTDTAHLQVKGDVGRICDVLEDRKKLLPEIIFVDLHDDVEDLNGLGIYV